MRYICILDTMKKHHVLVSTREFQTLRSQARDFLHASDVCAVDVRALGICALDVCTSDACAVVQIQLYLGGNIAYHKI